MQKSHLRLLACPHCSAPFEISDSSESNALHLTLHCATGHHFPIVDGIPRFVSPENYADSFGYQWKKFSQVQLDSCNGSSFSEERFKAITGWGENELSGKLVLDAGCGAGRFAEIVLNKYHANLVACDLSSAVDVCRDNVAPHKPLICQASIYETPFREGAFDFVYSIGVIQHTPDPFETIRALCRLVKPGGQIGLWIYELNWKSLVGSLGFKYALRPLVTRMSLQRQTQFCKNLVDMFFPIVLAVKERGLLGKIIMRLLPVSSAYLQSIKLSRDDLKTWVLLDTFDMYTPAYDKPQRFGAIVRLLTELGFDTIRRHPHGAISITAQRKA